MLFAFAAGSPTFYVSECTSPGQTHGLSEQQSGRQVAVFLLWHLHKFMRSHLLSSCYLRWRHYRCCDCSLHCHSSLTAATPFTATIPKRPIIILQLVFKPLCCHWLLILAHLYKCAIPTSAVHQFVTLCVRYSDKCQDNPFYSVIYFMSVKVPTSVETNTYFPTFYFNFKKSS